MTKDECMKLLVEKLDDGLQFNDGLEFDTAAGKKDSGYRVILRARKDPFSPIDAKMNPLRSVASVDFEAWAFGAGEERDIEFLANLILRYFREKIAEEVARNAVAEEFAKKLNERLAGTDMTAQTSGIDGSRVDVVHHMDDADDATIILIGFRRREIEMVVTLGDEQQLSFRRQVLAIIASLAPTQFYSII